ncbi:MAG: aspartate-semialdehyde dehydrogenase [Bdellovibrionaceae bacterium]|nr:aspartate-semialdehyde dehydrogenase [Pseudobdellovibrionaceae bacterium]
MGLNIGVVGATGAVGEAFLKLLIERNFPINELRLYASEKSLGHAITAGTKTAKCEVLKENCFQGLDLVFFSSGDDISKQWAPHAVECNAFAVDNSAAFRMSPEHKLIVPEINGNLLPKAQDKKEVIANPNCSTIQLVVALAPLALDFGISRVIVSTYQSVSGAGKEGKEELLTQTKSLLDNANADIKPQVFAHPIAFNSIPQIGSFNSEGFSSEEVKIMTETRKILNMPKLPVSAFTVRVPTLNGHGEAVWVTLNEDVSLAKIHNSLNKFNGLKFVAHNEADDYPTVRSTDGKAPVFVGRVHKDLYDPNTVLMWVVADNLYKGAALNGLQIAEKIFDIDPLK